MSKLSIFQKMRFEYDQDVLAIEVREYGSAWNYRSYRSLAGLLLGGIALGGLLFQYIAGNVVDKSSPDESAWISIFLSLFALLLAALVFLGKRSGIIGAIVYVSLLRGGAVLVALGVLFVSPDTNAVSSLSRHIAVQVLWWYISVYLLVGAYRVETLRLQDNPKTI